MTVGVLGRGRREHKAEQERLRERLGVVAALVAARQDEVDRLVGRARGERVRNHLADRLAAAFGVPVRGEGRRV